MSAFVASVLGVAALAASLTVGSSLHNLISSPRQQGWNWDVLVGNPNDLHDEEAKDGALLAKDPYVASYSAIAILAGAVRAPPRSTGISSTFFSPSIP